MSNVKWQIIITQLAIYGPIVQFNSSKASYVCTCIFLPARLSYAQPTATSMPPRHHGRLLASHWLRHLVGLGRDSRPTDMLALAASTDVFYTYIPRTITIAHYLSH